jgi:hypothetical protein
MKRRTTARTPATNIARTPDSTTPDGEASEANAAEKRWEVDQAEGIPAPVIRANMISLRVSYQGRVQVAFFDQR